MLPRINNLGDIRDFLILLYQEEKNNQNYFKNTNYIVAKGRNYLDERENIVDYFKAKTRERTWDPFVFEKHIFHALNLMGFSVSRKNLWLVNKELLNKLFNISDGLGKPLNKKEKQFFKKLLFDEIFRKKILFEITDQELEYVVRWSDIFANIFYEKHSEIIKLFNKTKIPLGEFNIKQSNITTSNIVKKIIQQKLNSFENGSESSIEREMSTFIAWNKQLDVLGEIPKTIAKLTLGVNKNLYYRIEDDKIEDKFALAIINIYVFLRKKYEIVQIPVLKCIVVLKLTITIEVFDNFFLIFRKNQRGNITFSSTSPAYFKKADWGELEEWIYKENGINYLTLRLKEDNVFVK